MFDVLVEGEVAVEDDSKVVAVRGGNQGGVVKVRWKSLAVWEREVGPIGIMSDLSQLSLRKVACIHDLISQRPFNRVEWVEWEVDLVVTYSWTSSA